MHAFYFLRTVVRCVNARRTFVTLVFLLPGWAFGQGTFAVRFDQSRYAVDPGGTFQVSALIDPVPAGGLFSFGVQLLFEPTNVQIASDRAIVVSAALNFNGPAGIGALKVIGPGSAGAKGSIDPSILPPQGYIGSSLVSFQITDLSLAPGQSYQVRLGLFRTLGPTESVFVSGNGEQLDNDIAFGTALVEVVPEPSIVWILLTAALAIGLTRKQLAGACGRSAAGGGRNK